MSFADGERDEYDEHVKGAWRMLGDEFLAWDGWQCKYQFISKCSRCSLLSLVVEPHHLRLAAYMWHTHVDEHPLVTSMTSWKLYFGLVFDDLDVSCILKMPLRN